MNILSVSVEVAPFSGVGGLSQGLYYLPKALRKRGNDARVFTANHSISNSYYLHKKIDRKFKFEDLLKVPTSSVKSKDNDYIECGLYSFRDKNNQFVYLLNNDDFFGKRTQIYNYDDDHSRFYLLSKAVLEWLLILKTKINQNKKVWWPDIIQCNDWHTSYLIDMARRDPRYKEVLKTIPLVLTVHNFKYQGDIKFHYMDDTRQDNGKARLASMFSPNLQIQNALIRGLLYSDAVNTVSKTHAREVLLPEYSWNLTKVTNKIKSKMVGIMNGLDYNDYNPNNDTFVKHKYNLKNFMKARPNNKLYLQELFDMEKGADYPMFAYVGRIDAQKGIDLLISTMKAVLKNYPDTQFVVLGEGEDRYCEEFRNTQIKYKGRVGLHLVKDFRLPRVIYSGADFLLVPSRYEPGGIVVLEALRYGCVPIVKRTGGMCETVSDFSLDTLKGNGFSFTGDNFTSFYGKLTEGLMVYRNKKILTRLVKNCMNYRRSWDEAAMEYEKWFTKILRKHNSTLKAKG